MMMGGFYLHIYFTISGGGDGRAEGVGVVVGGGVLGNMPDNIVDTCFEPVSNLAWIGMHFKPGPVFSSVLS